MKHAVWILFLAALANGADLPTNANIEVISDYSGGLNTLVPAHKLANNYSPNMRNVFTHRVPGKLITRGGFVEVGSTSSLIDGRTGYTFYHNDGSSEFLVSDSSMLLSTQDFQTYVFISSALNPNAMLEFAQINNKVYITNGIDAVFTWDADGVKQVLDGTNGTPNVPKGRHIAAYQNRIFVGNTTADNTSLDWSAVVSTGGAILTPDHYLAWPDLNNKSIGSTDGEALNALWVQRGQLQIGKDGSIWTLFGDSDSTYIERKIETQAGVVSQESVVLLDGVAYHKGRDGIYAYNGSFSQRISDSIEPDVAVMANPSTRITELIWETQADFDRGYSLFGATMLAIGVVTVSTDTPFRMGYSTNTQAGVSAMNSSYTILTDGGSTDWMTIRTTETIPISYSGNYTLFGNSTLKLWAKALDPIPGAGMTFTNTLRNMRTGDSFTYGPKDFSINTVVQQVNVLDTDIGRMNVLFTSSDLVNGNMQLRVQINELNGSAGFVLWPSSLSGMSDIFMMGTTTGNYISDIATVTGVTSFGNFNSVYETQGGNIAFFYRTSTSVINIATQTWRQVFPGTIVNSPAINNYFQWASTISAPGNLTSNIDQVTLSYLQGSGAPNRPVAIAWNNEYWLSIATDLASNLRLQYVKSWFTNPNPNSWNVMAQMNMGSLFKDGSSTLYGGSSNSGTFYRLDYGTNDDGQAIDAFYETPDMTFTGALGGNQASGWWQKQLHERWVDIDRENGGVLRLGTSIDGGAFTERLIPLDGTGNLLYTDFTPKMFGKTFRFRIRSSTLDKGLNFNGLALIFTPLPTRGN